MSTKVVELRAEWTLIDTGPVTIVTMAYEGDGRCVLVTSDDRLDPRWNEMAFAQVTRREGTKRVERTVTPGRFLFAAASAGGGGELAYTRSVPRGSVMPGRRRIV